MTPAARYAAAVAVLEDILQGRATEAALLGWSRSNRYAGSKDRAAVRDIVFSIQRRRRSAAAMGGGKDAMSLLRGYLAQEGVPEEDVFGAGQYAPPPLSKDASPTTAWEDLAVEERADLQPWVLQQFQNDVEGAFEIAEALRHRAPLWLRVNLAKTTTEKAYASLADAGHAPELSSLCPTALRVTGLERQVARHSLVLNGSVEFQDLAPQRAVSELAVGQGHSVLDYCAGGGGKSLALAAKGAHVTAHDEDPKRMSDIARRASLAGARIERSKDLGRRQFDMVVCDVPCSGSGAWRRAVDSKWTIREEDVGQFVDRQRAILKNARAHVRLGGTLVYMTCSLFAAENSGQADWASVHLPGLTLKTAQILTPLDGGDGFFWATFHCA